MCVKRFFFCCWSSEFSNWSMSQRMGFLLFYLTLRLISLKKLVLTFKSATKSVLLYTPKTKSTRDGNFDLKLPIVLISKAIWCQRSALPNITFNVSPFACVQNVMSVWLVGRLNNSPLFRWKRLRDGERQMAAYAEKTFQTYNYLLPSNNWAIFHHMLILI